MNTDYVIYITTKHGRAWKHVKENNGWTRTGPNGRVYRMSAEQLLSHILPPLAGDQQGISVMVERRSPREAKSAGSVIIPEELTPRDA